MSTQTIHPPQRTGLLSDRYRQVRAQTQTLAEPLAPEDCVVQSMPDASPTKWHLAHTTWFFETFILKHALPGYQPFHPGFDYLFNSYYLSLGQRHCRPRRGLISRPTCAQVLHYRRHIDDQILHLLAHDPPPDILPLVEIGLHHEQQHQELILTDIKHLFASNPLQPIYREQAPIPSTPPPPMRWIHFPEGIHPIGHEGEGFAYDNESPRHRVFLNAFHLATRLVTNAEYKTFIADNGYRRGDLWLSEGWKAVQSQAWQAPLYWEKQGDEWHTMTLSGPRPVNDDEPACHLSYFEADAFARWAGARLPTEQEWELASHTIPIDGPFLESGHYHPTPLQSDSLHLQQMFGDLWQWTASAYLGYPGYRPPPGALGEYNGKFMCNQFVLRGGSCATPRSHIRRTYRNFFPPDARWQFTGLRLARDA